MGNRGNIILTYENGSKIYFYSHWGGDVETLGNIIKNALIRGKDRWDDEPYLARIIFSEMIKDDILETTGYGISPYMGDGEEQVVKIDFKTKKVNGLSFEEFIS